MKSELSRGDFLRRGGGAVLGLTAAGLLGAGPTALASRTRGAASYTYKLWNYSNSDDLKKFKDAVAELRNIGGNTYSFRITNLTGSGAALYPSKIQSLIASGQPPDTWESWGGSLAAPYIERGAVLPLDAWFKEYGWRQKLASAALNYVTVNGRPMGVPVAVASIPVFYNKTLFEKAGVSPPKTYDQWEQVNDALKKAGVTPASAGGIYGWDLMRLFEHLLEVTAGPKLHDQLQSLETGWNKPAVVDAFGLLKKWGDNWLQKGFIGTKPDDSVLLFAGAKAAQQFQGGWIVHQLEGAGADIAEYNFFMPPGEKGPARVAGFVQQYLVSNKVTGARLDALGAFFNAFLQPAIQRKYLYEGGTSHKQGVPTDNSLLSRYLRATVQTKAYLIQDQSLKPKLSNAYFTLQSQVSNGSVKPKDAARRMDAAVKRFGA